MKKITMFLVSLVLALGVFSGLAADTVIISPIGDGGFETGTTFTANGWTTVGTNNNYYRLGTIPGQYAGNRCAYLSSQNNSWTSNGTAVYRHLYRDVTLGSTSEPVVTLSFWYKINGAGDNGSRGPSATDGDGFKVFLQNTTDAVPAGAYPSNGVQTGAFWYDGIANSSFNANNNWQQMFIAIPSYMAGSTKRLVLRGATMDIPTLLARWTISPWSASPCPPILALWQNGSKRAAQVYLGITIPWVTLPAINSACRMLSSRPWQTAS